MLFKTGQAAGIFLKHKAKSVFGKVKESPKRKALFKKIKAKYKAGKLKTEYDQILSSGTIKKSKQATDAYLKSIKNRKISSAVDVGLGLTGGYLIGRSTNKKDKV